MLRKGIQKIRQDRKLLLAVIILSIFGFVILSNVLFYVSPGRVYPQIDSISYTLSGGAREVEGLEGKFAFEAWTEFDNSFKLDISINIYDFQGNTELVNVWFRYECDPRIATCRAYSWSSWSGVAEGTPPLAHSDREWRWYTSPISSGEQRVTVSASITIWFQEGTSPYKDNTEYYLLDITPEDTEGNEATWQYRIDIAWVEAPAEWYEGLLDGDDNGDGNGLPSPSFEYLSVLMVIPILIKLRRKKREENG